MKGKRTRRQLPPAEDLPRSQQGIPYRYELREPPAVPPLPSDAKLVAALAGLRQASQKRLLALLITRPGMTSYELSLALDMDGGMPNTRLMRMRRSLKPFGLTINRPKGGVYFGGDREAGSRLWLEDLE